MASNGRLTIYVQQDTGIMVRKKIIQIFRDICIGHPEFPKVSEMCIQMIRRVGDEDGIKVISRCCLSKFPYSCTQKMCAKRDFVYLKLSKIWMMLYIYTVLKL